MKTPKISVILPCYNIEDYIERCLGALTNQTLGDIEIICVDDKSTDKTNAIIEKYAKQDNRVILVELKQNSGAAIARNAGLDAARGEYIGFVDPDDYVDTDFYEKLYNAAKAKDCDVVIGNVVTFEHGSGKTYTNDHLQSYIKAKGLAAFSACFWSAIYKHSFLIKHKIRFPDQIRFSQDCVFLTRISLAATRVALVDDTFYHYFFQRPNSLDSSVLSHAKAESKYNAFNMNLQYINETKFDDDSQKYEFILNHVFGHVYYEIQKKFQHDTDRRKMFDLLRTVVMEYLPKQFVNPKHYPYLVENDYNGFIRILHRKRTKRYMFGIPVVYIYEYEHEKYVKLFKVIPFMKIIDNRKFFLFYFLPIWFKRG